MMADKVLKKSYLNIPDFIFDRTALHFKNRSLAIAKQQNRGEQ
jgi:hypothetical protein